MKAPKSVMFLDDALADLAFLQYLDDLFAHPRALFF